MQNTKSDILFIGGGIAGLSAGAFSSKGASVTVLEAEERTGYHASGRSAALFIRNYGNAMLRILNQAAWPVLNDPSDFCDGPVLSPRGFLMVARASDTKHIDDYLKDADGTKTCSTDEAISRCPILKPEAAVAAIWEEDASDIDVDRLMQGYASVLKRNGGTILTGQRIESIERDGTMWRVTSGTGVHEAPLLVNAAGAWAGSIAEMAGERNVGLRPLRRSAAILPAPDGMNITGWPMVADAAERWYAKPDAGRLMVSPADEDPVEPHDAWPDDMVLAEGLDRFEQATTMQVTRLEASWAGLRTFAPDRTPVVGFGSQTGFFWLAGQGGYGVQTSPALGRLAADMLLGRSPELPGDVVSRLSPDREMVAADH